MSLKDELHWDAPIENARHEALLSVVHTANLLDAVGAQFFREFDLTEAQFNVLYLLHNKTEPLTQSALSERLVVTRGTVTSVLNRLEKKGLIVRQAVKDNRRSYHIELTPDGKSLISTVSPLYFERVQDAMSAIPKTDCKKLTRYLEKLREGARTLLMNEGGHGNGH